MIFTLRELGVFLDVFFPGRERSNENFKLELKSTPWVEKNIITQLTSIVKQMVQTETNKSQRKMGYILRTNILVANATSKLTK